MRKLLYVGSLLLFMLSVRSVSADPALAAWTSLGINDIDENSTDIRPAVRPMLNQLAMDLKQHESFVIVKIEGYTDDNGDPSYNLRLSQSRADKVRDYLVKLGVPKYKIRSYGWGTNHPIASNAQDEGRSLNRRVEITVQWDDRKTASTN